MGLMVVKDVDIHPSATASSSFRMVWHPLPLGFDGHPPPSPLVYSPQPSSG